MVNIKYVKWFFKEIPALVNNGVISESIATNLQEYYSEQLNKQNPTALVAFSIIGSLLVGLGVILILAHNWEAFSRTTRAVISFLPLVFAQILTGWILYKGKKTKALCEGLSIFYALSIGVAISLISQTYHISGDLEIFLMTWALLTLPIVYLLNSAGALMLYFIGITSWSGYSQYTSQEAMLFWILFALVLPYYWKQIKTRYKDHSTTVMSWTISLCLIVATGITLEKVMPGLWIIIYSSLLSIFYLLGVRLQSESDSLWAQPFLIVGGVGNIILSLTLTFKWCWEDIGWHYMRTGGKFHEIAAIPDYILAIGLPIIAIYFLLLIVRKKEYAHISFGLTSLLGVITYAIANITINTIAFNLYTAAIGIERIIQGVRNKSLAVINIGMVVLIVLIAAKFFDSSIDFVIRGAIFIILGAIFLGVNIVMARKKI